MLRFENGTNTVGLQVIILSGKDSNYRFLRTNYFPSEGMGAKIKEQWKGNFEDALLEDIIESYEQEGFRVCGTAEEIHNVLRKMR